jgi:hypothetical protein
MLSASDHFRLWATIVNAIATFVIWRDSGEHVIPVASEASDPTDVENAIFTSPVPETFAMVDGRKVRDGWPRRSTSDAGWTAWPTGYVASHRGEDAQGAHKVRGVVRHAGVRTDKGTCSIDALVQ